MDIQTSLIYVAIVGASAVVLFAVAVLGVREKTYEEAIAEQRQMPSERLLLGRSAKEKKQKRAAAGKKVKEKPEEREEREPPAPHHHVEFEEPAAEVLTDHAPPHQDERKLSKTKKKKAAKSILANKSEHSGVSDSPVVDANHFEESQPKDDLLLKRKASREDLGLKSVRSAKLDKPIAAKSDKPIAAKSDKPVAAKSDKPVVAKLDKPVAVKSDKPVAVKSDKPIAVKEEKPVAAPKKVEPVVVEPVEVAPVYAAPLPLVAKTSGGKKKKSELSTLLQMTGDRAGGINVSVIVPLVQKAELARSEIQILIDLLLNKQQGSAIANSEWIEGRQDPVVKLKKQLAEKEKALLDEQEAGQAFQNKMKELRAELNAERSRWRQMEDVLAARTLELQHANARLQHAQDAHKNDKANLSAQLQQLQSKVGEDHAMLRKLQEDQGQSQGALKQEFHAQRQKLELHIAHLAEQNLEAEGQANQIHAKLQEQESVNAALRLDMQAEVKMYRDKVDHLSSQLAQREQLSEEIRHHNAQLEHHAAGLEAQLNFETDKFRAEVDALKFALAKSAEGHIEAARSLHAEKEKAAKVAQAGAEQVSASLKANAEKERLYAQLSSAATDNRRLREENESLAAQVTAVTERPAAEGRENGDVGVDEEKGRSDGKEVALLEAIVKQKEDEVLELTSQINNFKTDISALGLDLESQRQKNNELRTRNWKAMEALSAAEKSLAAQKKDTNKLVIDSSSVVGHLLHRLFPEVAQPAAEPHATWVERFVEAAQAEIAKWRTEADQGRSAELEKQVAQLNGVVANYKNIIQDTQVLLMQLQNSAEEEEVKWREKLSRTESDLEAVREDRERLEEALQEERERLLAELSTSRKEAGDLSTEVVKLRGQLQLGQAHQLDKLNGVAENHSGATTTNGADTDASIAEAGSGRK